MSNAGPQSPPSTLGAMSQSVVSGFRQRRIELANEDARQWLLEAGTSLINNVQRALANIPEDPKSHPLWIVDPAYGLSLSSRNFQPQVEKSELINACLDYMKQLCEALELNAKVNIRRHIIRQKETDDQYILFYISWPEKQMKEFRKNPSPGPFGTEFEKEFFNLGRTVKMEK